MEDNYSQWEHHEAELERLLTKRPVCCRCRQFIQEENLWDIHGELYCEYCASDEFRKWTEDYIL